MTTEVEYEGVKYTFELFPGDDPKEWEVEALGYPLWMLDQHPEYAGDAVLGYLESPSMLCMSGLMLMAEKCPRLFAENILTDAETVRHFQKRDEDTDTTNMNGWDVQDDRDSGWTDSQEACGEFEIDFEILTDLDDFEDFMDDQTEEEKISFLEKKIKEKTKEACEFVLKHSEPVFHIN